MSKFKDKMLLIEGFVKSNEYSIHDLTNRFKKRDPLKNQTWKENHHHEGSKDHLQSLGQRISI